MENTNDPLGLFELFIFYPPWDLNLHPMDFISGFQFFKKVLQIFFTVLKTSYEIFILVLSVLFISELIRNRLSNIISYEPIDKRPTSKYFHESSLKSVRINVIGPFWRTKRTELYPIAQISEDFTDLQAEKLFFRSNLSRLSPFSIHLPDFGFVLTKQISIENVCQLTNIFFTTATLATTCLGTSGGSGP